MSLAMLLTDFAARPPDAPELFAGDVSLRVAAFSDHGEWAALRAASRAHLTAWEPAWTDEDVTEPAFRRRVRAGWRSVQRGHGLPLLVFERAGGAMVGGVTISGVRRGASRSATLGYWIGAPFVRRGYARSAVSAALEYCFGAFGLHRVEAACQPENEPSRRLLASLGFEEEGYAREYLFINGEWRDHLLFARIANARREGVITAAAINQSGKTSL